MADTRRGAALITWLGDRPHAADVDRAFTQAGATSAISMNAEGSSRTHVTFRYPVEDPSGRALTALDIATRAAESFDQPCTAELVGARSD